MFWRNKKNFDFSSLIFDSRNTLAASLKDNDKLPMTIDIAITRTRIVRFDFHRLIEAIDNNRLIIIDYTDYIDCFPMIDFHRLGTPGISVKQARSWKSLFPFSSKMKPRFTNRSSPQQFE